MSDILLGYDIDYALSYEQQQTLLQEHNILPVEKQELCIVLVTGSQENKNKIDFFIDIFQSPIKFVVVDRYALQKELHNLPFKIKLHKLAQSALDHIHKENENSFIIQFMQRLFLYCIKNNASDIHFETLDKSIVIRLRIDGELMQVFRFSISLYPLISSIIKYFGNLDIAQRRIPLNGRFTVAIENKDYDMRISTLPTVHGESIVLRILDNGNIQKDLNTIGFDQKTLTIIQKSIRLTQGLVLVTGPTGSGKTTTLYSMISSINTKNKKIITIEDPVEYKLDGVMQVNINNEINLSYEKVLKNILRQDPDVILIGEIRDSESLQIAMQASLTGHLVIATLHTNNALETLTRLLDLKAKPYLISSTVKMILSQRLVRILCPQCKQKEENKESYKAHGCISCNYTGYASRQVVSEVLEVDQTIARLISENVSMQNIKQYIEKENFQTLQSNGLSLVEKGVTSFEEYYSKV